MAPRKGKHHKGKPNLIIAYDDGAHSLKCAAMKTETGETIQFKIISLVAPSGYDDVAMELMNTRPVQIELPNMDEDRPFGNGTIYTVGESLLRRPNVRFATGHERYLTKPDALVRYYACLGKIAEWYGEATESITAHVEGGVNTERYLQLKKPVEAMLFGDQYFRYSGKEVRFDVVSTNVGPQAFYAARSVENTPPDKLKEMLADYPMGDNPVIVIDIGNFSTDVALLQSGDDGETIYPEDLFAVELGVNDARQQLSEYVVGQLRQSVTLNVIDNALTPGHRNYGRVPNLFGGGFLDVSEAAAAIRRGIWSGIYQRIANRPKLRNMIPRSYVIAVGGGSIIYEHEIAQSELSVTNEERTNTLRLGDHPAYANTKSEWSVLEGMLLQAQENVAS